MRCKFLLLVMLITVSTFAQNSIKVNVPGFGKLPAILKGDKYSIKIAEYGTFDFKGSIKPVSLEAEVTVDQLKKFPGYKVMSNLGLEKIWLKISTDGLEVEAKANTKKSLGKLCEFLKIKSPYAEVSAKIGKGSFELSGKLAFSDKPIKILSLDKFGTKVSFYSAGLGAAYEPGSVEISVSTELKMTPTKFDPELTVEYEFKYDLVKQNITGSGTLMGKWVDPFGMDRFVKKNSIIFENGAIELGVNIATLTPSTIAFALEHGKLFNLDFGIFLSVSPADKEFAFYAENRTRLTLNQVSEILRNNFGLNVPDIFPKDYYLDSLKVKFAPGKASVKDIELDKGFALAGAGRFKELDGFLDFNFDLENEFTFTMEFKGDYSKFIWNEAKKIKNKTIRTTVKKALDEVQIQRIYIDLNGQKKDLKLNGKMFCELKFQGKTEKISFKASLDAKQIAKNLTKKLIVKFSGPIADVASASAKQAVKIAGEAAAVSKAMVKDAKTYGNHAKHTKEHCDKECVPARAKKLSGYIVDGSYDAVNKFYYSIFNEIGQVEGDTPEETRELRSKLIKTDWDKICKSIDDDWKEVLHDKAYVKYYTAKSSAEHGGKLYRAEVKKYMDKEKAYRDKVWERMMTREWKKTERKNLKGEEIPEGTYYIQSAKAGNSKDGFMDITYNHKKKTWKRKGQRLEIWTKDNNDNKKFKFQRNKYLSYYIITPASDSKYALDCKGRGHGKKTPIHLWSLHKGASQQFYFKHVGGGKFAIIPKSNHKMCLALVENKNADKGNKIHLWTYSDSPSKQWYLINAKTGKKYIPKK